MSKHVTNTHAEPEVLTGMIRETDLAQMQGKIRTTGSFTLPFKETEATQYNLDLILSAVRAAGHEVPDRFLFSAGQVFYRERSVEEVRLSGFVLDKKADTEGPYTRIKWTTSTSPKLMEGPYGTLILDSADIGRMHFSALTIKDQEVAFLWDLLTDLPGISRIAPIPDAFPDEIGRLPNNPLVAAGMAAIYKGGPRAQILLGGWRENEAGRPIYQHTGVRGGRILIYPNLVQSAADPLMTTENLWKFIRSLNPFTGDVALAVLAQLCEPSLGDKPKHPLLESVRISADSILSYKGIQRWGMERRLLQKRVFEEMERLRALYFDVEKWPAWNPKTGKWDPTGVSWQGDRLFDIVKVEMYQESLFEEREQIEVSWSVRAGQWAYWWLNAQGRVWISRMARVLLDLDHRENRGAAVMAKKIGQRVALLDGAIQPGMLNPLRIDHLIESVGELPMPEERVKNWAGRTRERFDEAMLKLQEVGVFAKVEWPDDYGPGDPDRSKGWVEKWLTAHVQITLPKTPPELPKDEPRALPEPQRQRKPGPRSKKMIAEQQIDSTTIRKTRIERGWSQEALAQYLNVTQACLSQVETGKRLLSKGLMDKLCVWLKDNTRE